MLDMLKRNPLLAASAAVMVLAVLVISGALVFEHVFRYEPCELCYLQRKPWYAAASGGLLLTFFASKGERTLVRWGLLLLGLTMVVSTGLGIWHAGIEWKFWPGPASCTGSGPLDLTAGLPDLNRRVVLCDEAPLRILGLSFAGWNAVVSFLGAVIAFWGLLADRRRGPAESVAEAH